MCSYKKIYVESIFSRLNILFALRNSTFSLINPNSGIMKSDPTWFGMLIVPTYRKQRQRVLFTPDNCTPAVHS